MASGVRAAGPTGGDAFWVPEAEAGAEGRYRLVASEAACIGIPGRHAPMGGVTTGAAIEAMEHATGKSLIWATAQFLNPAPTDEDFEIHVEVLGGGSRTPQARATLLKDDRPVLVASGALGRVGEEEGRSFVPMPAVPDPQDCPSLENAEPVPPGGLMSLFERRLGHRDEPAGRNVVWFRPVGGHAVRAGLLAIIGDFLASAHTDTRGSIGLDNTLRVVSTPDTRWILADMRIAHIGERIFHGSTHLFSEAGRLMAIASLSGIRPRRRSELPAV